MSTLEVDNLSKEYATPTQPLVVLSRLSLQLQAGDSLAILGPSGSGKSTLLAILGALDRPTSGKVTLDGVDPFALDDRQLAAFRRERIGFVFQDHHLLPQLTVLENVLLPFLADGTPSAADRDRATALVEEVGLAGRVTHRPAELSGGERQRPGYCWPTSRRVTSTRPQPMPLPTPLQRCNRICSPFWSWSLIASNSPKKWRCENGSPRAR